MYPIPPDEHLVEMKKCRQCSCEFPITDKDMEFYEKVSPTFGSPPEKGGSRSDEVSDENPLEKGGSRSETEAGRLEYQKNQSSVSPSASQLLSQGASRKYLIPPPTLCPDCRQQRRLAWRNERKLYKRKCDATGKDIVSIYSPDKPFTVYHQDYWWSDNWDPKSYGREFDFTRSAMEQMSELMREMPRPALLNTGCTNSDYVNYSSFMEDSYLVFDSTQGKDLLYGNNSEYCAQSIDFSDLRGSRECYAILECNNCYNIAFAWGCNESHSSRYVVDLDNAHHCFLSHTIYNKSYIFENKSCTPDEYRLLISEFYKLSIEEQKNKIDTWKRGYQRNKVYPYHLSISFQNSSGYGLLNVQNATACYSIQEGRDIKYCSNAANISTCYDIDSIGEGAELVYEVNAALKSHNVCFAFGSWGNDLYYCDHVSASHHLFLCTGLRNASYCILNRQYTKEEYEKLVPRIIEHMSSPKPSPQGEGEGGGNNSSSLKERGLEGEVEWGEFFPASMSPFGYNETVANEYYPIASPQPSPQGEGVSRTEEGNTFRRVWIPSPSSPKGEGVRGGGGTGFWCNWSNYESPFPSVAKVIPASKLPDTIDSIPDDILNWAIECEVSGKPFRIIKQELEFYRKHHLPIPRRHPDQRHLDRMKMRNPRKLFERLCDCPHCEENSREKGIILREGENAGYRELEQNPQSSATLQTAPLQRSLKKRMITTYSPERSEIVYCSTCYDKEVLS